VATALNFEATGDGQVAITGDFAMIFEGTSNVVDQYVAYLRRKLGSEVIETAARRRPAAAGSLGRWCSARSDAH